MDLNRVGARVAAKLGSLEQNLDNPQRFEDLHSAFCSSFADIYANELQIYFRNLQKRINSSQKVFCLIYHCLFTLSHFNFFEKHTRTHTHTCKKKKKEFEVVCTAGSLQHYWTAGRVRRTVSALKNGFNIFYFFGVEFFDVESGS